MSTETVARRYAAALADVVLKTGETDVVQSELKTWEEMMNANGDLLIVFRNPAIQQQNKETLLANLIEKTKPSKTTANFLRVLLRNHRLTELGEINKRFASVLAERSGIATAQITSARPLGETEKVELKTNLEKLTGKKVDLTFDINEELIGGVVTKIGSTVYDGSIKTQLQQLKEQLVNGQ
ncbi:MAG: synthase subcomplex delta subunit [Acidobacteria bacterium]|jgi:F-type H+-transporting ATPase subunit delta|nr:synthase subcomplex delta subunit [Acidobacteriota bacterium]